MTSKIAKVSQNIAKWLKVSQSVRQCYLLSQLIYLYEISKKKKKHSWILTVRVKKWLRVSINSQIYIEDDKMTTSS